MGCCNCKSKGKGGSKNPPAVAIIGVTGYIGKFMMPVFLEALDDKQFKELRILITQDKTDNELVQSYVSSGATISPVPKYDDASAMAEALEGIDVVVSTLGVKGEEMIKVQNALIEAMVTANVKVYFPSEYGTNHYKLSYNHPVFEGKKAHYNAAKDKGLRVIRMLSGDIMEASFGKWFGLDCKTGVWTVVGNGADVPCAMTAEKDIARFTVEAVLLAHKDPKCPDEFEVYSDMRTLRDYAKEFDKKTGWETTLNSVPKDEFVAEYNSSKEFTKLLMILIAEGAYDYTNSTGNELLNPNESLWKLKKIEDYAEETAGIPWADFDERLLQLFPMGSLTLVSMVLNSSNGISSVASAMNLIAAAQAAKLAAPPKPAAPTIRGDTQTLKGTIMNPSIAGTVMNQSMKGTIMNPSITGTVMNQSMKGTVANQSIKETIANQSIKGTIANPSIKGTIANPSIAGTVKQSIKQGDTPNAEEPEPAETPEPDA